MIKRVSIFIMLLSFFPLDSFVTEVEAKEKIRIAVVSSYHPEYLWTSLTNEGVLSALLEFGYLDNVKQGNEYTRSNRVESSKIILQKYWMDSKRKNSRNDIAHSLHRITATLEEFNPDLVLLGDDNAANYVGNYYLDKDIPVVFWGVNGEPLKYGLLDSMQRPGHNITGIYQAGYHREGIQCLQKLLPDVKRIAVLSDDSPTGRPNAKKIQRYATNGELTVELVKVVITNSYKIWKQQALMLQGKVDAFFISTHHTLKDEQGNPVDAMDVANWYLRNIHKPEVVTSGHIVEEGMFMTVDDSPFNQGYEAAKVAHSILSEGKNPAEIASYAPERGPFVVNRWRAKQLGLMQQIINKAEMIDQFVDEHKAMGVSE